MKLSDFDYPLPQERIAQTPLEPRDSSRLLVLNRKDGSLSHSVFSSIGKFLHPGDLLVINRTRVLAARLFATKLKTGGKVELLLLNRREPGLWEALVGGKRISPGICISVMDDLQAEVVQDLGGPRRLLRFNRPVSKELDRIGYMPLPPYIHQRLQDPERYQTVYSQEVGSAAAPTAGLHFTPHLIRELQQAGIGMAEVVLHVGLDTFAPVTEENIAEHQIHTEWCQLSPQTASQINQTRLAGGRIIAVGTTSVRTLESAASQAAAPGEVEPFEGHTDLFILPGYQFNVVDAMVTNFHLPKSTLLMLVSAFASREMILNAYKVALEEEYRFFSFGDAMLIV
ncbi:MAG: tRNA preQ1(34) S-adenosylmethionine ribosyltransferase-isomerase QueA [Anaerolineales bacterium]|nr:tRNA preQ1(34) S-adenosylmethionine ribosyltransferase-isomerase QueA [Anaerolineales bacterium]